MCETKPTSSWSLRTRRYQSFDGLCHYSVLVGGEIVPQYANDAGVRAGGAVLWASVWAFDPADIGDLLCDHCDMVGFRIETPVEVFTTKPKQGGAEVASIYDVRLIACQKKP